MRKPFDIEAAKNGAKVVTRDGRPVEILKYNDIQRGTQRLIVCSKDEDGDDNIYVVNSDGSWIADMEHNADIFIEAEPTYRPYANSDELLNDIKKHGLFVKDKSLNIYYVLLEFSDVKVFIGAHEYSYSELKNRFTWFDGVPCGVQEGGTSD